MSTGRVDTPVGSAQVGSKSAADEACLACSAEQGPAKKGSPQKERQIFAYRKNGLLLSEKESDEQKRSPVFEEN